MKVKEIIEELSKVDPETEVSFQMNVGCCGDTIDLDDGDIDVQIKGKYGCTKDFVRLSVDAVAGYYSCRQIGVTIKSHNDYWEPFKKEHQVDRWGNPLNNKNIDYEFHADGVKEVK